MVQLLHQGYLYWPKAADQYRRAPWPLQNELVNNIVGLVPHILPEEFPFTIVGLCSDLYGHSKIDKTKVLKTNGSLMKVKSIAECSLKQ